jgi:hypothetical protein
MGERFKQGIRWGAGVTLAAALVLAGCSNSVPSCSAPSTGTFKVQLSYSQTIPVDLSCDEGDAGQTGDIDASACASQPHPFDGATWTVTVSGSGATITTASTAGGTWSCVATAPRSGPASQPDGSTSVGTGCYLLLECAPQSVGDAGPAQVQVQLLAQASTDVVVIVHSQGSSCCTDQYTGSWH